MWWYGSVNRDKGIGGRDAPPTERAACDGVVRLAGDGGGWALRLRRGPPYRNAVGPIGVQVGRTTVWGRIPASSTSIDHRKNRET